MTTPLRRRIRHTRRWLGYGVLLILIALALMVGIANQLLPMVERHPDRIASWLSQRVGEPVKFSAARAEWTRRGPRFIFDDLHVGRGSSTLVIGRAQLQVAMYSGLLPGQPLTELKIRDLALELVQGSDGRWEVLGLPAAGSGDPLDRLDGFGELQVERARFAIRAPAMKIDMRMPRVDARIRVSGPRLRVGVSAWVSGTGQPVSAVLDFDRKQRDGLLWVGSSTVRLSEWAPLMASAGIVPIQGRGSLGLWARIDDRRVDRVTVEANVDKGSLRSTAPLLMGTASLPAPTIVRFDNIKASSQWSVTRNGWQVYAPVLNITRAGHVAHLDGLRIAGGERFRVSGRELDLSSLGALLSLSDRFPDALRRFLQQSLPQAVLTDVEIQGHREGRLRGSMMLSELTLQPVGQRPGLTGLAGRLEFDERGGVIRLHSSPVRVDWPVALRKPQELQLSGTVALWKTGDGWTAGTHRLRIKATDFSAELRAELGLDPKGGAPTLNLAADLGPSTFEHAKQLWIRHRMPASAIDWLDRALVSGTVEGGRIVVGGDLDDWPFRGGRGRFDARARIRDATLVFNPGWPAGEHLDLDVVFDGPGFQLDGSGMLKGNRIARVSGGIADFRAPWLDLSIKAEGSAENLRQLLLVSPLQQSYGDHLRALTISGQAGVGLDLHLPLKKTLGTRTINGLLDLNQAALADSRWDIKLTRVVGRTRFSDKGFSTENLRVLYGNEAAVFNLRVGSDTGDANVAALATLEGRLRSASLLDRYADLAWLKPSLVGSSNWNISVQVPPSGKPGSKTSSQLRVSSDLVGTSIELPAPLKKPANQAMAIELLAALPIEEGELTIRLADLMRLRGRIRKDTPFTGAIQFGPAAMAAAPSRGLSIRGHVPDVDAAAWVGFAGKGGSKSIVQEIDITADQLIFLDRGFANSRLQLRRSASATQVLIKGAGIEGTIDIPGDAASAVQGRFERIHLGASAPAAAAASVATPVAAPSTAISSAPEISNPSELPPLRFSIADLRIGRAQLGKAELQTSPTPSGLRVDKFSTRARNLSLDAAGEWVRAGTGTRSNFRLDFTTGSLGKMLDALGYADVVQGGKTRATLAGSWPGSPGAFGLATLTGSLKAEVGTGRLLDVEPGGSGRILGLISLAEIPRRLSLDFSDFFEKGFSFNTANGDFLFRDGKARTDNLTIDGPAAEIRVTGNTGLREQVYDQRVEVLPKAGGLLPAIGLLAGGPAGAAVGAVAQAVLQRPLKQTTRVVYRVTGPWQKPVVKVIEKGPARTPTAANAARAPTPSQP